MIYIFWTCRELSEARKIVRVLLDKRLIACGSILPEVESIYRWEGTIEESHEVKVILKTEKRCFEPIQACIQSLGSYEVPEISEVEVTRANAAYLSWVCKEIQ